PFVLVACDVPASVRDDNLLHSEPRADVLHFLVLRRASTTLFPYTTLFRSMQNGAPVSTITYHVAETYPSTYKITGFGDFDGSGTDRKSTRLNSSHVSISYAVFCLKRKNR